MGQNRSVIANRNLERCHILRLSYTAELSQKFYKCGNANKGARMHLVRAVFSASLFFAIQRICALKKPTWFDGVQHLWCRTSQFSSERNTQYVYYYIYICLFYKLSNIQISQNFCTYRKERSSGFCVDIIRTCLFSKVHFITFDLQWYS